MMKTLFKDGRGLSAPIRRFLSLASCMRRDTRGVIVVTVALLLPIVLGFAGLAYEVGSWYAAKRGIQNAADSAAISGAYEKREGGSDADISAAAEVAAERDGSFDTTSGDTIVVNTPPGSGAYTGDGNAVEVELGKSVELIFSGFFMEGDVTVVSRAVATSVTSDAACVLTLDTTGTGVDIGGTADVTFDNCVTASNSTDADALAATGSGSLTTDCFYTAGGVSDASQMTFDDDCTPTTNGAPLEDPYADLTDPGGACAPGYESGFVHNDASSVSIGHPVGSPDYDNPFVICGDLWARNGTVTLNPGLYVIDGGDLKSNASGNLVGEGVTIVLRNNAQIDNFNGSSTVDLKAPVPGDGAGDWQGILFYQDRATSDDCTGNNCNTLNGNSSSIFQGTVYFPNQEINVNGGNVSTSTCLQLVAKRAGFSGNSDITADNDTCEAAGVDVIDVPSRIKLVE
jgi:Flp pilus assembly protein TadG